MQESLLDLLELQKIDGEIASLKRSKLEYPKEIAQLEMELEEARRAAQEREEGAQELASRVRHFERELAAANEELKRHQDRLYEVTSNREYDALQHEIEACRNRIDDIETEILTSMAELEETKAQITGDVARVREVESASAGRMNELKERLSSVEREVDGAESRRHKIEVRIAQRILRAYDRIRKAKGGLAVVPVIKGACGGCFRGLPPQLVNEVRKMNRIVPCESCGRLLVWKEDEA